MFSEVVSSRTMDVVVKVQTAYVQDQSSPELGHFMFAYRVMILNESEHPVQLLRRQWIITDALGQNRVVEGEGVVGQQPVIMPGAYHEYVSGCDFHTPMGQMKGYYFMERLTDGASLKVRIPTFVMAAPFVLN